MRSFAGDIRLLELQDQRIMPWKNGGGITRELAVFPGHAALAGTEPFLWRISIADIAADGPFSAFPGYDRSIMLIAGQGMELDMQDAAPVQLRECYKPLRFSGDTPTYCRLLDGPVRDFNVMSARGRIEHHCEIVSGGAAEAVWERGAMTVFCHCLHGNLIVKLRDMAEWNLTAGQSLWLPKGATRETTPALLAPNTPQTVAALVTLRHL